MLAATSLWGTSGPAQALAHTGANPAAVGATRLLPLAIVGASLLLAGIGLASLPLLLRRAPAAALAETPS